MRGPRWLPWVRRAERRAALEAAAERERQEHERACQRLRSTLNTRWNGPTEMYGIITRGQLDRYDTERR